MEEIKQDQVEVFKGENGIEIAVRFMGEEPWLTQAQISELFQTDRTSVTKHLQNIIKSSEIREESNVQNLHIANSDKPVKLYGLSFVLAVGYRVSSKRATQFRVWATSRLRDYLLKGYAVNEKRLKELEGGVRHLKELEQVSRVITSAMESSRAEGYEKELLKIVTDYATTWTVLSKYDQGELGVEGASKKKPSALDYDGVKKSVEKFRARLGGKGEAGDLFGREVGEKFKALLGNIHQTFGGKDLYPSVEERAAHLLYFCIKDHPFADGNKRIGSLVFLLYLVENRHLLNRRGERKVNDTALAALALLIAESKPDQKETMVHLVVTLIASK